MNIGSDVGETGAHGALSFFAEVVDGVAPLLGLGVEPLAEIVVTLFPSFLGGVEAVAQERDVRVQPLTELLERLAHLLVVNL